jgi:protein TonB
MFIDPEMRGTRRPPSSPATPRIPRAVAVSGLLHIAIVGLATVLMQNVIETAPVPLASFPIVFSLPQAPPAPNIPALEPVSPASTAPAAVPPPPDESPPASPSAAPSSPLPQAPAAAEPLALSTAAVPTLKPRPEPLTPTIEAKEPPKEKTPPPRAKTKPLPDHSPAPRRPNPALSTPTTPGPQLAAASPVMAPAELVPPRPLQEAAGNRKPEYPQAALRRHIQGVVRLLVDVSADGRAESVNILKSSGNDMLDASAVEAVRSWRFLPATRGGKPVPGKAEVPIRFILNE